MSNENEYKYVFIVVACHFSTTSSSSSHVLYLLSFGHLVALIALVCYFLGILFILRCLEICINSLNFEFVWKMRYTA